MYFSDTTNKDGIVQEIDDLCLSDTVTYSLATKARRINAALDRYEFLAITSDGTWEYDDKNNTDLPVASTNLVSGQRDYSLPGFSDELFGIEKILAADPAGNIRELYPVNLNSRMSRNIWETTPATPGVPYRYEKFGESILLDAVPNYNYSSGLKIVVKRRGVRFTAADTLTRPGIPSIHHMYLAHHASLPYLLASPSIPSSKKNDIAALIQQEEESIKEYYSKRAADEPTRIIFKRYRSSR